MVQMNADANSHVGTASRPHDLHEAGIHKAGLKGHRHQVLAGLSARTTGPHLTPLFTETTSTLVVQELGQPGRRRRMHFHRPPRSQRGERRHRRPPVPLGESAQWQSCPSVCTSSGPAIKGKIGLSTGAPSVSPSRRPGLQLALRSVSPFSDEKIVRTVLKRPQERFPGFESNFFSLKSSDENNALPSPKKQRVFKSKLLIY